MTTHGSAPAHYLSKRRRDPVKVLMEEVVSHRMFGAAIDRLGLPTGAPLRVLDIGAGTGDGLALLRDLHGEPAAAAAGYELDYLGVDLDPEMVRTARSLHSEPGVRFEQGDVRHAIPEGDFDLCLSSGVPYSYLDADDARRVVSALIRHGATRERPFAVLVDVLGRYSIEWTPRWGQGRWNYAMTFFEDVDAAIEEMMSFYDRESLGELVSAAARDAGAGHVEVGFTDRSVMVGRHTATRSFNRDIPPYRALVNRLCRSEDVPVDELRFTAPATGAPVAVLDFFRDWAAGWNALLDEAAADQGTDGGSPESLARALLDYELSAPRGLGVGHSLTATIVVDPT